MGVTMGSQRTDFDVIVAGLGGMGSAAAFHLARAGQRVLGLDAFGHGHSRGSSHGRSRIIREAYYEAPEYVPLVRRAYALWRELEAESGKRLLQITGGLTIGPPDGELVQGVKTSAVQHGIEIDVLDAGQVARRFPPYCLPDTLGAAYEANAGILDPEACVTAHCDLAIQAGAELRFAEPVEQWDVDAGGVRVRTAQGSYRAPRLVIAAGAWASALIGQAGPYWRCGGSSTSTSRQGHQRHQGSRSISRPNGVRSLSGRYPKAGTTGWRGTCSMASSSAAMTWGSAARRRPSGARSIKRKSKHCKPC